MVNIEDIPFEERWKIATRSASSVPLMYDNSFRKTLGKKYDELERPIWLEAGKQMKELAMALGLPSGNAREIGDTLGILSIISFGPEFTFEEPKATEHGIAGKITGCAILNRATEMGLDPKIVALPACKTMMGSAVESLNPEYIYRSGKNMCSGDEYCETIIKRRR